MLQGIISSLNQVSREELKTEQSWKPTTCLVVLIAFIIVITVLGYVDIFNIKITT